MLFPKFLTVTENGTAQAGIRPALLIPHLLFQPTSFESEASDY